MLFGILDVERDPLRLADLPGGFVSWIQDAGGFAAVGLLFWLVFGYPRLRPTDRQRIPSWLSGLFVVAALGAALCYTPIVALGAYDLFSSLGADRAAQATRPPESRGMVLFRSICLTAGGVCALIAALLPFLRNAAGLRARRVWAITRLSFKEAIRRRVLYAFSALLLVFLFASWFIPNKPEYQVQTYVSVVFLS